MCPEKILENTKHFGRNLVLKKYLKKMSKSEWSLFLRFQFPRIQDMVKLKIGFRKFAKIQNYENKYCLLFIAMNQSISHLDVWPTIYVHLEILRKSIRRWSFNICYFFKKKSYKIHIVWSDDGFWFLFFKSSHFDR